jgi:hypothetical protein
LQPVSIEEVTSEDSCIICLDSFQDPDTTSTEQQIVKLPPCRGHYFHRSCVAGEFHALMSIRGHFTFNLNLISYFANPSSCN